jgi:hypothetical protein
MEFLPIPDQRVTKVSVGMTSLQKNASAAKGAAWTLSAGTVVPSNSKLRVTQVSWMVMVPLPEGDTVVLQGCFRAADGAFAADHTSFWGCKVG